MLIDIAVREEVLSDNSPVFNVVFTPLMPEGYAPVKITFYCYDEKQARALERVLDDAVCGVAVDQVTQ